MIHFVSAWYNPRRPWYSTDDVWFRSVARSQSDDTVTQLRIFRQGDEEVGLVILNYAPSLRRYLHGRNIFDVPYWSFFDQIQGLEDDYTRPIDFLRLEWPEDVSFFYNPFIVTVMRDSDVYARVYLARDGTLQSIRYYGDGILTLERIFDDRGFLSSVLMHDEDGHAVTQYYLSRTGDVILSEDLPSGRIDIVQNPQNRFRSQTYDGWEALIAEFLQAHLRVRRGHHDTLVLALSPQHNDLVASVLDDQTLVLARSPGRSPVASSDLLHRAGAVFVDSEQRIGGDDEAPEWALMPVLAIYPLERRPTFGASANESTVYISLFADNIRPDELDSSIAMLAAELVNDENARLLVCTFRSQDLDYLKEIRRVIAGYQNLDLAFFGERDGGGLGADLGIGEGREQKIQLVFIDREADLLRMMGRSRVFVDLGTTANRHLATEAVNAGVPQVNRSEHPLSTHLLNGFRIDDVTELPAAMEHFLSGLEHWNQSLVRCRVLEDLFGAQEILGRWDLIKEVAAYADPADRA